MARKPAKPAEAASEDIPTDDTAAGTTAAEAAADVHTEGAEPAEQHAGAPMVAPDADGQGPAGGEERSDLPADQSPAPEFDLMVVCHRKGGRRRADRRWDEGESPVNSADLTPFQLAEIHGDPQFTIFTIDLEKV